MFCLGKFCFFVSLITFFCDLDFVLCSASRKLSHYTNPNSTSTSTNFFVIKAEGPADSLYYVWDFHEKPLLLIIQIPGESNFTVDWDNFEKSNQKSISFTSNPSYMFALIIANIFEFNDKDDSGILHNDDTENIKLPTEYFNWRILGFLDDKPDNTIRYSIGADSYQYGNITKTGLINITSCVFGNDGHSIDLPHLQHTENSTQIDLILDNLQVAFNQSRFAVEILAASSNKDIKAKLSAKKTLDDENTPGVFILDTLRIGDENDPAHSAYLQWRPIVYTSPNKVVTNSTKTFEYDVTIVNHTQVGSAFNSSLILDAHEWNLFDLSFGGTAENISFGSSGDGFYSKTKYSSWSLLVGVGTSPEPQFSMVVFLIIAIGLGLPTLIILGGTAFIIYRKVKSGD